MKGHTFASEFTRMESISERTALSFVVGSVAWSLVVVDENLRLLVSAGPNAETCVEVRRRRLVCKNFILIYFVLMGRTSLCFEK